jgi:ABC-type bacteriocin/lantibiotic exporter with double-glycine peptidase domain
MIGRRQDQPSTATTPSTPSTPRIGDDTAATPSVTEGGVADIPAASAIHQSAELLETLAGAVGVPLSTASARRAARAAASAVPGAASEVWAERLREAGREIGLRVTVMSGSPAEAVALAAPTAPAVMWLGDAATGRPVVLGLPGTAADLPALVTARRTDGGDQAGAGGGQGGQGDGRVTFAVADSARPADGLRGDGVSRHGRGPLHHGGDGDGHGHGHGHGDDGRGHGGHGHGHGGHGGHGHDHPSPLQRLWGLMRPEWPDVRSVIAFSIAVGVLNLATPLAVEALVGFVAFGGLLQPLVILAIALLGFLGFSAVIRAAQTYIVEVIQRRLFVRVAADLAWRLPRVRVDAYDRHHGPELVNRFFDVLTVQKAAAGLLLDGVNLVLGMAVALTLLAFYHPYLLAFDLALLLGLGFIFAVLGRGAVRTSIEESYAKYAVAGWLEELARCPNAVKAAGGAELALERTDRLARDYLQARSSHFRVLFRQIAASLLLQAAAGTALLGIGGVLVMQGELTLGQLVAANLLVGIVVGNIAKFGKHLDAWYDLMAAVDKLGHLADLPLERQDGERPLARPASAGSGDLGPKGSAVELADVSFHAAAGRRPALHGVSLRLPPGERVAVAGPGTRAAEALVDLLFGLRRPDAGRVEIDGMDVREWRLSDLRARVAVADATPEVLEGTVAENLRLGREDLTNSDLRSALEAVGLWEDVAAMPRGMETLLTTSGGPLDTDQVRRLGLARAIAGRPRLLVVDGALDGLDPASLGPAAAAVLDASRGWTAVVITNREDVAARCDRRVTLTHNDNDHGQADRDRNHPDGSASHPPTGPARQHGEGH